MTARLGLALYTLRGDCARDPEGTLAAVAEMGFEGVELYDLFGRDARAVRALLDELGLEVCARHTGLGAIENDLDELSAELRELGTDRLVLAWIPPPASSREAEEAVARIDEAAARVTAAGLRFGFHNHDGELRTLDDGRTVLDRLLELPPERLFLELDLGWAWFAGVDPVDLVARVAPRAPLVHVKDIAGTSKPRHVPVGDGDVGYARRPPRDPRARRRMAARRAGRGRWLRDRRGAPLVHRGDRSRRERGMSSPAQVGIIGCGVISRAYAANASAFDSFEIGACADLEASRSEEIGAEFSLRPLTVEELLRSDSIDVVLNLTPPASHASVTRAALEAGKHVYSEKPLAIAATEAEELCALAESEGLRLACAPDIFLGSAYQKARSLLDDGAIGEPLAISAAMLAGGQEVWHPDPDIFYRDGAGPLLDMGPYYVTAIVSLLGPVRRVAGFASTLVEERTIKVGPRRGERFTAETPTHITSMLELQGAVTATLVATFEAPGHYASTMLVHGSDGELALPDPNGFAGPVRIRRGRGTWEGVPFTSRGAADARGLGLHDMVEAIAEGRPHRASAQLATHVVDVARSILASCESGSAVAIASTAERPDALPVVAARRADEAA